MHQIGSTQAMRPHVSTLVTLLRISLKPCLVAEIGSQTLLVGKGPERDRL